jgi:predicted nucleic acid-binding protein
VKLVVEEAESRALIAAIEGRQPHLTSVVGAIEVERVCKQAGIPRPQADALRANVVVIALDDRVIELAGTIGPAVLRTLDAIHLATALSLADDLQGLVTYDGRLGRAAEQEGLPVLSPV